MGKNLNWFIKNTAPGSLFLQSWLTEQGIDNRLTWKYAQNGWLTRFDNGVYYRSGREPDWVDAVYCLQHQWKHPFHLAGLTSLNQQGRSHYLALSRPCIWLCVEAKRSVPKWLNLFEKVKWVYITNRRLNVCEDDFLTDVSVNGRTLRASGLELAAYEIVDAVPTLMIFTHAAELFQVFSSLSPKKVQKILNASSAVQTNRLFLFLAHYNGHSWTNRLDEHSIIFGSGNRQIEVGGKLDKTYRITVPSYFIEKNIDHG